MQRLRVFLILGLVIVGGSAGMAALILIAWSQGSPYGAPASASSLDEALANFSVVFVAFVIASVGIVWYRNRGNWF